MHINFPNLQNKGAVLVRFSGLGIEKGPSSKEALSEIMSFRLREVNLKAQRARVIRDGQRFKSVHLLGLGLDQRLVSRAKEELKNGFGVFGEKIELFLESTSGVRGGAAPEEVKREQLNPRNSFLITLGRGN